ncbi:MAG: SPOR domain-containing protein [Bacteroidetes bacterium]|nr:SPOR domain-containing protein [Bacteroidota bacterium]
MKIARYIADLLYEYECVVIPGLGGFISKVHGVSIHPVKNQFKPPFKEVVFNPHLRTNDGLLLNHIAVTEKLTYQEAKGRLDRFVLKCLQEMEKGRRIAFRKIGNIYFDDQKNIVFQADESQNYLASSFGLTSFVSHAIVRGGQPEKQASTPPDRELNEKPKVFPEGRKEKGRERKAAPAKKMVATKRPNPYKKQLTFIGLLLFFLGIGWGVMNKHAVQYYYQSYASLVPFFYASPNEYLANNLEKLPIARYLPGHDKKQDDANNAVVLQETNNNLEQAKAVPIENLYASPVDTLADNRENTVTEPVSTDLTENVSEEVVPEKETAKENLLTKELPKVNTDTPIEKKQPVAESGAEIRAKYFIIAGAFREKDNAEKLIGTLKSKGFDAGYAGQTKTGLWRVCYAGLASQEEALQRLESIKQQQDPNAWLFIL